MTKDSNETVAMPGDADEQPSKNRQAHDEAVAEQEKDSKDSGESKDEDAKPRRRKKAEGPSAKDAAEGRGEMTPAQVEGDGWNDTPIQMRG